MTKSEIRLHYKNLRRQLSPSRVEALSLGIANNSLKADIWQHQRYHLFLPIEKQQEVDTTFILNILQGKDKEIVLSKSDFNTGTLEHFLLTEDTRIVVNAYGIPEPQNGNKVAPEQLEVVFVPLMAYDNAGNRVGYGKGFYDRFLKDCPRALKIGLSFFEPSDSEIPEISPQDIPLDMCITPMGIRQF